MKLRNKKTGDVAEVLTDSIKLNVLMNRNDLTGYYTSLAELNEEWEDYEEPKENYIRVIESFINYVEEADESFYCDDSVKKFAEKLKAWKRLKDKGFRFDKWVDASAGPYSPLWFYFEKDTALEDVKADLDLLFGGKE